MSSKADDGRLTTLPQIAAKASLVILQKNAAFAFVTTVEKTCLEGKIQIAEMLHILGPSQHCAR